MNLPNLAYPVWTLINSVFAGIAWAGVLGIYAGIRGWWLVALCFTGLVIGAFLIHLAPWLATEFPNGEVTVADLARDVLAANYGQLVAEVGSASKRDVWETLRRVIVAQTGVDAELIKPGAPLVETLRID